MQKVKGVDISENNGSVNFGALKAAGVQFVLIRCGYGNDDPRQDDKLFFENVRKAKEADMPYGAYFYSYALNDDQAQSEAAHALRLLRQVDKPAYGVWFDMEDADHYKKRNGMPSNASLQRFCDIFCRELEKNGYYAGIYAAISWLENQLNNRSLDRYDKWVAQWNDVCQYQKPYGIWQYTDKLVIGGAKFDANWAYKDYPALTGNVKKEEIDMTKDEVINLVQEAARKAVQDELAKAEKARSQADMPQWAEAEAALSRERGIYLGDSNGNLRPMDYATKVETAVMVNRGVDAAVNIVRGLMEDRNG